MSTDSKRVQLICSYLMPAGEITYKSMFGEYGLFRDGQFFGTVCNNSLFIKVTEEGKAFLGEYELREYTNNARKDIYIENLEDKRLPELVKITCEALAK